MKESITWLTWEFFTGLESNGWFIAVTINAIGLIIFMISLVKIRKKLDHICKCVSSDE
tara:strand:- start:1416 stop:1589 length:174 start_codon:yes stop_codon:yes gene_type:complete